MLLDFKHIIPSLLLACFMVITPILVKAQIYDGDSTEINLILSNIKQFSQAYMDGDFRKMAEAYTEDGKIMPNNTMIIEGHEAIYERWVLPEGVTILKHKVMPEEIKIIGDYAYDIGYYEGQTKQLDGNIASWKGKYVIVWQKVEDVWKIYVDIWNRVQ